MAGAIGFHVVSSPNMCLIDCKTNPLRHLARGIAGTVLGMVKEYDKKKDEGKFRLELVCMVEFLYSLVKGNIHNRSSPYFEKDDRELIAMALNEFNDLLYKMGNRSANWTDLNSEFLSG